MAHRTFGNTAPTREPVTFTLTGVYLRPDDAPDDYQPEVWEEAFTCVPVAPAGVLDDLAASVTTDGKGNQIFNAPSLLNFMRGVLVDADVPRMEALAHDKRRLLELQTLGELVMWLSEQLLGRPSTPASS